MRRRQFLKLPPALALVLGCPTLAAVPKVTLVPWQKEVLVGIAMSQRMNLTTPRGAGCTFLIDYARKHGVIPDGLEVMDRSWGMETEVREPRLRALYPMHNLTLRPERGGARTTFVLRDVPVPHSAGVVREEDARNDLD